VARLAGHGRAKYTTGTRHQTSRGRGWHGLLAERWSHSEGDLGEIEPRDTEVIVMLRGGLRVRRRGDGRLQEHEAVPGTVWICPAGIREDMIHLYGEIEESVHIYLPATPFSATALQDLDIDPDKVCLHYDGGFRDPLIEQIARAVHAELVNPAPGGQMLVETLASALGVYVLRHHSNLSPASIPMPRARGALDVRRLQRVMDFIEAHLDEEVTLETLAREACLSPFHFARAFKAATGTTPHRYLTNRRLEHSKALIAANQLPLAAIAAACGFSSQAHFTKSFKEATGATPGVYRAGEA